MYQYCSHDDYVVNKAREDSQMPRLKKNKRKKKNKTLSGHQQVKLFLGIK